MLKKCLKIGMTNVLSSAMPIVIYFILSFVYQNDRIGEGFTVTYFFQFIFMALYNVLVIGQVKGEAGRGDVGSCSSVSGLLLFVFIGIITVLGISVFGAPLLHYFNRDPADYREILIYGLSGMIMDYTLYLVIVIFQYREDYKKAFMVNTFWYLSRALIALSLSLAIKDSHKGLIAITLTQFAVFLLFMGKFVRIKTFRINIRDGVKYFLSSLPQNMFLTLIYFTGYGNASVYPGYFEAYNLAALCTDTQWDILSNGIDTAVSGAVCRDFTIKLRKMAPGAVAYACLLFISSGIMFLMYHLANPGMDMTKAFIIYLLECGTFPVYGVVYTAAAKLTIIRPTVLMSIFTIIRYTLRTFVTLFVKNPYSISFGVITSCTLSCILWFIIWLDAKKHSVN